MSDENLNLSEKQMMICHCCLRFKSYLKTDMDRHYSKKRKCTFYYKTSSSREDTYILSTTKKYVFHDVEPDQLSRDDCLYIVRTYSQFVNHIYKDFRSSSVVYNSHVQIEQDREDDKSMEDDEFRCNKCNTLFSTKGALTRHWRSKYRCEHNRLVNENREISKNISTPHIKPNTQPIVNQTIVNGGNVVIGNVTNNQNTQNNIQNNTKIEVRDFIHEIYDHSHLEYTELSRDFFLLDNFLNLLMENKANHNVLFMDSDLSNAVVLTRNDLRKMPSDKVGFMMIEKLYQTMDNMILKLCRSDAHRKEMHYLSRYYKVIMDKYRWDTTYREYDVDTRSFYGTSQGRQLRCRDEYLADIIRVLNKHRPEIKEDIFQNIGPDAVDQQYLPINPNIEDYCSVRARYKDMKS